MYFQVQVQNRMIDLLPEYVYNERTCTTVLLYESTKVRKYFRTTEGILFEDRIRKYFRK
jgi:hypothetical protein